MGTVTYWNHNPLLMRGPGIYILSFFFSWSVFSQDMGGFSTLDFKGRFDQLPPCFNDQGVAYHGGYVFLTQERRDDGKRFLIHKVGPSGDLQERGEVEAPHDFFPIGALVSSDRYTLFYIRAQREQRGSTLGYWAFNQDLELENEEVLFVDSIAPWFENETKGASIQTFSKAVEAALPFDQFVPADFKWYLSQSPNGKEVLAYRFDYSRQGFYVNLVWIDSALNPIRKKELRIDETRVVSGIHINDYQEIFLLNTDALGLMELIKFDSTLNDFDLLEISPSHAMRDDFMFKFWTNREAFVGAKVDYEGELEGLMYAKFNFDREEVERIHFYPVNDEDKERVDSLAEAEGKRPVRWDRFHLVSMDIFNEEEVMLGVEEIEIQASGKPYEPWAIDRPQTYPLQKSAVIKGSMGFFSFNIYDELRWKKWIPNYQKVLPDKFLEGPSFVTRLNQNETMDLFFHGESFVSGFQVYSFGYTYGLNSSSNALIETRAGVNFAPSWSGFTQDGLILPYQTDKKTGLVIVNK